MIVPVQKITGKPIGRAGVSGKVEFNFRHTLSLKFQRNIRRWGPSGRWKCRTGAPQIFPNGYHCWSLQSRWRERGRGPVLTHIQTGTSVPRGSKGPGLGRARVWERDLILGLILEVHVLKDTANSGLIRPVLQVQSSRPGTTAGISHPSWATSEQISFDWLTR